MPIARRLLLLLAFVTLLVAGWYFAASNSSPVEVNYLLGRRSDVALWAALTAAFVIGAGAAGLLAAYPLARNRLLARRYRKKLARLEAEIHQLRNLPLVGREAVGPEDALGGPGAGIGSGP